MLYGNDIIFITSKQQSRHANRHLPAQRKSSRLSGIRRRPPKPLPPAKHAPGQRQRAGVSRLFLHVTVTVQVQTDSILCRSSCASACALSVRPMCSHSASVTRQFRHPARPVACPRVTLEAQDPVRCGVAGMRNQTAPTARPRGGFGHLGGCFRSGGRPVTRHRPNGLQRDPSSGSCRRRRRSAPSANNPAPSTDRLAGSGILDTASFSSKGPIWMGPKVEPESETSIFVIGVTLSLTPRNCTGQLVCPLQIAAPVTEAVPRRWLLAPNAAMSPPQSDAMGDRSSPKADKP